MKTFPEDGILENCTQDETQRFRTIEFYIGIFTQDTMQKETSHRSFFVRKVTRAASGTMKIKEERRRGEIQHDQGDGKCTKGKGPKGIRASGKRDQPARYKFSQGKCTNSSCYFGASS